MIRRAQGSTRTDTLFTYTTLLRSNVSIPGPELSAATGFFDADVLSGFVGELFEASGLEPDAARTAAKILVDADLRGVWSHGVARVSMYRERVRCGVAKARPEILIERVAPGAVLVDRSEEHTSELQSLMRISYAVFCLKKKNKMKDNI